MITRGPAEKENSNKKIPREDWKLQTGSSQYYVIFYMISYVYCMYTKEGYRKIRNTKVFVNLL